MTCRRVLAGRDRRQPPVADERPDRPGPRRRRPRPQSASIGRHRTMQPMLPDGRRLGAHLPLATGMVKAVDRAHEIGASAMQIFTDNPTAWKRRAEPPAELAAFRDACASYDIAAGRDPCLLPRQPGRTGRGVVRALDRHARRRAARRPVVRGALRQRPHRLAPRLGVAAASTARGRHRERRRRERRIRRAASGRRRRPTRPATTADAGHARPRELGRQRLAASGTSVDGAGRHRRRRRRPRHRRATGSGFCLDTAHAWGAGIDLGHAVGDRRLRSPTFDARIGLDRLVMVHLNDSRSERGSRTDRHEHLGAGRIGAGRARRTSCATRRWPMPRTSSRRRAWTRATTRSTWRGPGRSAAGRPLDAAAGRGLRAARQRQGPDGAGVTAARSRRRAARRGRPASLLGLLLLAAAAAPSRPRDARHVGRRPGPRHAHAPARLVQDGVVPLLGPPTSIGDVHHGAWYYYLLSPAAVADRRRLAARGRGAHRPGRDRRGRRRVVARP